MMSGDSERAYIGKEKKKRMNKKWIASVASICLLASSFTTVMAEGMKPGTYTEVTRGMYDGLTVDVTLYESKIEDI